MQTKLKISPILFTAIVVIGVIAYLITYTTAQKRLNKTLSAIQTAQQQVVQIKQELKQLQSLSDERQLISEDAVSSVLEEITRTGKAQGLYFYSMRPDAIIRSQDNAYLIQPIKLEIKGSYKQIGTFIGTLDNLETCLALVDSFQIKKEEGQIANAILTLHVYMKNG